MKGKASVEVTLYSIPQKADEKEQWMPSYVKISQWSSHPSELTPQDIKAQKTKTH